MCVRIIVIGLGLLVCAAKAEDPQKWLEAFRLELRAEIKALTASKEKRNQNLRQLESILAGTWENEGTQEEYWQRMPDALESIQANASSERLREFCRKFSKTLPSQPSKESEEREARLPTIILSALEKGLTATTAKEIDAPLAELAPFFIESRHRDFGSRRSRSDKHFDEQHRRAAGAAARMLSAYQIALSWGSDLPAMKSAIEGPQSHNAWFAGLDLDAIPRDVMVRGDLLSLLNHAADRIYSGNLRRLERDDCFNKQREMISGVRKLADLDEVLSRIDAFRQHQKALGGMEGETTEVSLLRGDNVLYKTIQLGMANSMRLNDITSEVDNHPTLVAIKRQLTQYALAHLLKSFPALPQNENESTPDFLRRVLTTAYAKADWETASRMEGLSSALRLKDFGERRDWMAVSDFLKGVNKEKVDRPGEAATKFISALQSGSTLIPVDYIHDRLKAIHQQFPDVFGGIIPEGPSSPTKEP